LLQARIAHLIEPRLDHKDRPKFTGVVASSAQVISPAGLHANAVKQAIVAKPPRIKQLLRPIS
jgi:hypothetical protein